MVNGIYVDPRITFTRAGTRTYYGQEMVKAEENLLLQSQTFGTTWTVNRVSVTSNTTIAPDGTTTADTITADGTTGAYFVSQTVATGAANITSVFAKAGTNNFVQIYFLGDTNSFVNFDITAGSGAVGSAGGTATGAIVDAGSGWYRLVVTNTATTATAVRVGIAGTSSDTRAQNNTLSTTIILWGAQLERRSFATAYTVTTTQPITRYQRLLETAAANEWPREFDPVTGECLGRSVWESRTNLFLRSEEFDNASWTKLRVDILPNQIIAPDGTLTADKHINTADNGTHSTFASVTTAAGAVTLSFYAKKGELDFVQINNQNDTSRANFNISNGTLGTLDGYTATIEDVGNGWFRCAATRTYVVATLQHRISIIPAADSARLPSFSGDGTSGIYIWGAQLESGAFASPYTPTVAAQVTRLADSAVMTGVNFSSWFNPEQGCLFMQSAPAVLDAGNGVTISDNTANNRIRLGSSTTEQGTVTVSGTAQAALDGGTPVLNTLQSVAMSYKFNDFALSLNGGAVTTDTTGTVPVVTQLAFATNEYIRRFTYYPQALTSANLQAVTR
jgi:hypothetical protein